MPTMARLVRRNAVSTVPTQLDGTKLWVGSRRWQLMTWRSATAVRGRTQMIAGIATLSTGSSTFFDWAATVRHLASIAALFGAQPREHRRPNGVGIDWPTLEKILIMPQFCDFDLPHIFGPNVQRRQPVSPSKSVALDHCGKDRCSIHGRALNVCSARLNYQPPIQIPTR
jgi:hypothetical protein